MSFLKTLQNFLTPRDIFSRAGDVTYAQHLLTQSSTLDLEVDPLQNSVVAACVNAVARALPDAPLLLENRTPSGWQEVTDHECLRVLRAPNEDHSDADIWGLTAGYKATRGQAFWLLLPDKAGRVGELHVWNPERVTVLGDESHFISAYRLRTEAGGLLQIPKNQIIHFRHLPDFRNPRLGWSPLRTGRAQILGDNIGATYHTSILHNAGVVSLLISLKEDAATGQVTPEQFQQVLTNIRKASRERSGGVEGINLPLEVHKLAYSPDEMNVDKLIAYYEARICAVMGVPQRVAGLGADPTYHNLSEALNDFWERRIVPDRNSDAATLNRQWLPLFGLDDGNWRFRFDFSGVPALQENQDALHARVRADWEKGLVDKGQARALLGYAGDNESAFQGVFFGAPKADSALSSSQVNEVKALIEAEWDEAKHPRDQIGRFSSGGSAHEESTGSDEHSPPINEAQAHRDLTIVHDSLGRIFPQLKSRWKGELKVSNVATMHALGSKSWACRISIASEQFADPARKLCTMIHESLHAYSPTTQMQYDRAPRWEEGVIENVVRLHRSHISKHFPLGISEEEFKERDKNHAYNPNVLALEKIRSALGEAGRDKVAFYTELQSVPATRIEATILWKTQTLSPVEKEHFDTVLAKQKLFLDKGIK